MITVENVVTALEDAGYQKDKPTSYGVKFLYFKRFEDEGMSWEPCLCEHSGRLPCIIVEMWNLYPLNLPRQYQDIAWSIAGQRGGLWCTVTIHTGFEFDLKAIEQKLKSMWRGC